MTDAAIASSSAATRRAGTLGVHSLDRFVFTVPELDVAERFYMRSASTCGAVASGSISTPSATRSAGARCSPRAPARSCST